MNTLESITPVELLMAADVKDVTEQEWEAALDACCKDLDALPGKSDVPLVKNMQTTTATKQKFSALPDWRVSRHVLADCFSRVLRCYVARARKAAKPQVSSHDWMHFDLDMRRHDGGKISWLVYDDLLPTITEKDLQQLREVFAQRMCAVAEKKAPAQQPVIPENGFCWAKKPDGEWVIYDIKQQSTFSVPVGKVNAEWVQKRRWNGWKQHHAFLVALCSLESSLGLGVLPKPADENTPWIVLTADGKLELEKVPVILNARKK
jgi:hypothetical protein